MNFEHLKTMTREQLTEIAGKQGLSVHPKAKNETIVKKIMDAALNQQKAPQPSMEHYAAAPQAPVDHNTPEQVEVAIADIKARVSDFVSIYNLEENTWHFKCRGAEECGNLDIPLRVIKMKAQTISRGRLVLMGLNQHFDPTNAGGKNAYTNTVLAG